jgi:hypothetical protein
VARRLWIVCLVALGFLSLGLICEPRIIKPIKPPVPQHATMIIPLDSQGIIMTGKVRGIKNTVSDTCLHEVLRLMGEGATAQGGGGLQYIWIYHKYKIDSTISAWKQLTNTIDESGGGDTLSTHTATASHTSGVSAVYDSILRERWTYGGYFTDSATIWYFSQVDTTVLGDDEIVVYDWTVTADSNTAGIQSALLYHIIYGLQTGACEKIDSMQIMCARDTVTVPVNFTFNFMDDSIIFTGTGTERDTVDTLKRVRLLDEDGTVMTSFTQNVAIDSNVTPSIRYAIGVTAP